MKLQNNFTTLEQSKQLLELGIPMNSADCIWYNPYYDGTDPELAEISVWKGKYPQRMDKYTYPCWSVGRLIEIIQLSAVNSSHGDVTIFSSDKDIIVKLISYLIRQRNWFDFTRI